MSSVFSENLKHLRLEKGLTQEQAAERLGVSAQSVSRWECGNTYPDVMLLPQIAALYAVTVDDLYRPKTNAYKNYANRLLAVYETTRRQEDFLLAQAEFENLMHSGAFTDEDYFSYGVLYALWTMDCADKAVTMLKRAQQEAKTPQLRLRARLQMVVLAEQLGGIDKFIARQLESVAAKDANAEEYVVLLAALTEAKRHQEALKWLRKAQNKFPQNAYILYFGGQVLNGLGNREEAVACWEEVLKLDKDFLDAQYAMAQTYEELGEKDKARKMWKSIALALEKEGFDVEVGSVKEKLW